jgi:ribokinase
MSGSILVVGSINIDLVVHAPRHPVPGETVIGSAFQTFPGGKGANQAVAAARLGAQVVMLGRVGEDDFGDSLIEAMKADGVDTSHILRSADAPTGVALITVDAAGQNTIVVASGANACLTIDDLLDAEELFEEASIVLLQLESPLETVVKAVDLAKKHNVEVVLNPAPAQFLDSALIADVDYLIPNEHEVCALAGFQDPSEVEEAARKLCRSGARCVIVTLGEQGAAIFNKNGISMLPAYCVQVVDTTAAGDAFVGAFAAALAASDPPGESVRWGNAAGALAVTKPGAQPSLPYREEVERLLMEDRAP